jgi:hypothetical protein
MSIDHRLRQTGEALRHSVADVDVVSRLHELPKRQRAQSARAVVLALAFLAVVVIPVLTRSTSHQDLASPSPTTPSALEAGRQARALSSPVTVQILNSVNNPMSPMDRIRLESQFKAAGYEVVATKNALDNPGTRIYYTEGHRADAKKFRERFPFLQVIERAPSGLSTQIALHVLVGGDFYDPLGSPSGCLLQPIPLGC